MSIAAVATVLSLLGVIAYQRRQMARLDASLSDATRTDGLTGLLNRPAFEELVDVELDRSRRSGRPLSVIVADIDGLAALNAERGHRTGDSTIKLTARDIRKWKRRIDSAGRIGGEEFALLLPEADERGAFLVAERLRRAAHRTFGDGPTPVTISFGVATYPGHGDECEVLMRAASRAMTAAKALGRDRSVIYSPEVARVLAERDQPDGTDLHLATVVGLAEALDIRDTGTTAHSHAVGRYAELIAQELGMSPEQVERVRVAGVLHDVGKIGVSDIIVTKPGPLDADEWSEMRRHPEIASRLLSHDEFDDLRTWVLAHHERPDGRGYPQGLEAEEIPLEGRILAIADAYEAMTTDRPYRPAMSHAAARSELEAGAGTQFDAEVVSVFLAALARSGSPILAEAP